VRGWNNSIGNLSFCKPDSSGNARRLVIERTIEV
jgi:hypothetical protein